MKRSLPKLKARNIFIVSAVCGLILNVAFDISAYRKVQDTDLAGKDVAHHYEVTLHLRQLSRALDKEEIGNAQGEMALLNGLIRHPDQRQLLNELGALISNQSAPALAKVNQMLDIQSGLLAASLKADLEQNHFLEKSLVWTSVLDGLFIALLFAFFMAELRSRRITEGNLRSSLSNLWEVNLGLREEQLKRQVMLKSTVHDLKNPLGSIRGFAELIAEEGETLPNIQDFSETIRRISQNSLQLVDSLLSPFQEERPEHMEKVDLITVLDEVCLQFEVQAMAKNQIFLKDFSVVKAEVQGNRLKLGELVANLLSNAIKYSPEGATIWVRCSHADNAYHVEIEDQGQGFSAEDKTKAFQFGQRLTAQPTHGESSSGIGLFVAKQIVDMHKGSIEIREGKSGRGACVWFEVPA